MPQCLLCELPVTSQAIIEGEKQFCCKGCHVVYSILSVKNYTENYQTHPLFLQAVQAGLISNPELINQIQSRKQPEGELQKLHFEIRNLWCPACADVIQLYLMQNQGIKSCRIDYTTDLGLIEFFPQILSKEKIFEFIKKIGYEPCNLTLVNRKIDVGLWLRFAIAAFCSMNVMMFSYPIYVEHLGINTDGYSPFLSWLSLLISLPVVTYCSWPIWKRGWAALKVALWGMDCLIFSGVFAAFILSFYYLLNGQTTLVYFDSMTVLITFVLLGKIIELKAKFSTRNALFNLERSIPKRARRLNENKESQFVPVKEVVKGDLLAVYSGEKVPLDGLVVEGEGQCNESIITGEALPCFKGINDTLISGSIVTKGSFVIRVLNSFDKTTLQKIIETIKKDVNQKNQTPILIEKITKFFVPSIFLIALFTFLGLAILDNLQEATLRAIAVILIACPCAIGIASPMVESFFLGQMIKLGAIVRNRRVLFLLGKEDLFVFDKTGTITNGQFIIHSGLENLTKQEKAILKTLCSSSNHPLAKAVFNAISESKVEMKDVTDYLGKGMFGIFQDKAYRLGSQQWMEENGLVYNEEQVSSETISTTIFFADDQRILCQICLNDSLQEGAKELILNLKMRKVLLSGDGIQAVKSTAKQANISDWKAHCSSHDKREYILDQKSQGKIVAMVGDGINDAPAITAADIGISTATAMEISIQVSDILLTNHDLRSIIKMRKLAKKAGRLITQNYFWAFIYNAVGILFAITGQLTPLIAAVAMVVSSLIVVLNSYRLLRTKNSS